MYYNDYHYWGMHLVWWVIWFVLLFWIFALPYNIPGQRARKDGPLDLLKKRFASGQISQEQYMEQKSILEK